MEVLILGGTRGLGLALAHHYLALGAMVTVCGRDPGRLQGQRFSQPQNVRCVGVDITDPVALRALFAEAGDLDLLIVTAGVYFNSRHVTLDPASTLSLLRTNVSGLSHALELASQRMLQQGTGQIAALSSMAGLLSDYPGASVYSATKRTVISLCDTYRRALRPFGIAVTVIAPGYVDTARLRELNGGDASHKPFLMSESEAVARIAAAIARRQAVCIFPWQLRLATRVVNRLRIWPLVRGFWEAHVNRAN
jgi:NADP-dependent 3-hydroxy acid dehydrogenase YdfG